MREQNGKYIILHAKMHVYYALLKLLPLNYDFHLNHNDHVTLELNYFYKY